MPASSYLKDIFSICIGLSQHESIHSGQCAACGKADFMILVSKLGEQKLGQFNL